MSSSLESLLAEGVITEIYGRLKSGKEAEVYAVAYGDQVVAAKVYKDRGQRSFKSNAAYKEGRSVRSSRSQRAMDRGSRFGQETAEEAWKTEEANALYKLHAAGVRVPQPVMFLEGVLLMELVRGADGEAAPRLIDAPIGPEEAREAYRDMLGQLVRILCCDLIHGDLSPYNVLWAASGPTIIDFPQIVSAAQNNSSEIFFMRDAKNILGHFASIEPSLRGRMQHDAREIWRAYLRRELSPDFMPSGRPPAPEARPVEARPRPVEPRPRSFEQRPRDDRGTRLSQGGGPAPRGPRDDHRPASRPQSQSGERPRLQMASPQANRAQSGQSPEPLTSRDPREQRPREQRQQVQAPREQRPQQPREQRPQSQQPREQRPQSQQPREQRPQSREQSQQPREQRGGQPREQRGGQPREQRGQLPQQARSQRGQPQQQRQQPQQQRQQQRPQRSAQRPGPEVIVLKRRMPEPTSKPEPETSDAVRGATNRRRR